MDALHTVRTERVEQPPRVPCCCAVVLLTEVRPLSQVDGMLERAARLLRAEMDEDSLGQVTVQLAVLLGARGPGDHHVGVEAQAGLVELAHPRGIHKHHEDKIAIVIRHEARDLPHRTVLDQLEMRLRLGCLDKRQSVEQRGGAPNRAEHEARATLKQKWLRSPNRTTEEVYHQIKIHRSALSTNS